VRVIGIVPAAGYATRLQPLACSKEVCIVQGRPVMDYVIERMNAVACEEIRIVTRPEKRDVIVNAERLGAVVVTGHPNSLADSIALALTETRDDDVALLGFPDSIWMPLDGYASLLEAIAVGYEAALGLFDAKLRQRFDAVLIDERGHVRRVEVKSERPSTSTFWGCAAARSKLLRGMQGWEDPGRFLDDLAQRDPIAGVWLSNSYVDIGTRQELDRLGRQEKIES
jgi:glucose-1-phosphate thymidylyltransferase